MKHTLAVLSDTHGLYRPELTAALQGVDHIIHAGDVGIPEILDALRRIAPVSAIRGNVDTDAWATALPMTEVVEIAGHPLYVLHDLDQLDLDPRAAGFSAVIYGHSHVPANELRDGVLFLNPGSIGPRRFKLPVCYALLHITDDGLTAERIDLPA